MYVLVGPKIYLSGIDILDGTPILDIKPYIPAYDSPALQPASHEIGQDKQPEFELMRESAVTVADWLERNNRNELAVEFTSLAERQLAMFSTDSRDDDYCLSRFRDIEEAKQAVQQILKADPRSSYRRKSCQDSLYYFSVDKLHLTCWFDDNLCQVLKVQPLSVVRESRATLQGADFEPCIPTTND